MMRPSLPLVLLALIPLVARGDGPDARLNGYRVAPGYKVQVAATEPMVINPVSMTFGDDGRLFVIEWTSGDGPNDHIKVLTDTDGDGTFDESAIYMDNLELPAGLLFWDGWTYLTLGHDVVRLKDKDGDGRFEMREVIATGFGNDDSHHRVSGLTMGPDGWIYITTGDSDAHAKGSDGSTATVLRSGGVFRCKPDGSHLENVAFGMRNPFGNVAFDDEFHIFHTDNDNEGSAGFTGCRILHVVEGGDYGWRLREGARCCQPDVDRATWNGGRPGRLGSVADTGRGAPAGLCVLNSAAFPPSTRNLLVYPDVFRKVVRAYKLKPAGATYTVAEEFELLGSDDPLFRPDDAEVGPDGALYVLDWRTDSGGAGRLSGNGQYGRIYRLTWSGTDKEPARATLARDRFVALGRADDEAVVRALSSDDLGLRRSAQSELRRRFRAERDKFEWPAVQLAFTIAPHLAEHIFDRLKRLNEDVRRVAERPFMQLPRAPGMEPAPERPLAPSAARRHAAAILNVLADDLGDDAIPPGGFTWITNINDDDPAIRRITLEGMSRFAPVDSSISARVVLEAKPVDRQASRARGIAIGRYRDLRRAGPGEPRDWAAAFAEYRRAVKPADEGRGDGDVREAAGKRLYAAITSDMLADTLLVEAAATRDADPFLLDGTTRGLERLGPAGIDAIVAAIESGDKAKAEAALYALQGWRTAEGRDALMAEATSPDAIPALARAGLFKALRELGPAVPPEPIVEWLTTRPKADPVARAEAIKVVAAMGDRSGLPAMKVLPGLLVDPDASVRRAGLGMAASVRSGPIRAALVAILSGRPDDEKALAVAALRGYDPGEIVPALLSGFDAVKDAGVRGEILRAVAAADFDAASKRAGPLLDSPDQALRSAAIAVLGQKAETALVVARRYNEGKLPAEDLSRVLEAIRGHATPALQEATQVLLRSRLLAAPTGDEARRLREYVARRGNPGRGKGIYLDAKKGGCAACHRIEGVGVAVGPDLTRVYETLTFDKRVESILEPSKEIKEGYNAFKVITKDGRTLSGLLVADTPSGLTLKDAQGKEIRVAAADVDAKALDQVSLMPAGVVGHLSFNELADLLAFLGDRAAQESLRTPR